MGITGGKEKKLGKKHIYEIKSSVLFAWAAWVLSYKIKQHWKYNPSSDHHCGPACQVLFLASQVLFSAISFNYTLKPKA